MTLSIAEVRAAMLKKLAASNLNDKDVRQLKLTPLTAAEASKLDISEPYAGGYKIPYWDPLNERFFEFYRYRRIVEDIQWKGFAAATEHDLKKYRYSQPSGAAPRAYFPPLVNWGKHFASSDHTVFITEGEIKAASATKFGFPTIGIGGVSNISSREDTQLLIPDLMNLPVADTRVYIVFDSDAAANPDILAAESRLASRLVKFCKAHPYIVRVPALKGLDKTGIDDLLTLKGSETFKRLLESAFEYEGSAAIHEVSRRVIFLRKDNCLLDIENPERTNTYRVSDALNGIYAKEIYYAAEGKKVVEKNAVRELMKWKHRPELIGQTYVPGAERIVSHHWNLWNGLGIKEAKRGNIQPWKELLDYLFLGHPPEAKRWFEQWLAFPLQHLGTKLKTAVVLWGKQGVGKTLIADTMGRVYGDNYLEISESELTDKYNGYARGKQFMSGDEITGGDNRAAADKLKKMITERVILIHEKFKTQYPLPNCINWLFTSNHCNAFFMEDDDRRFFILQVKSGPREKTFYNLYAKWMESEEGISALYYHLLHMNTEDFDPNAPAMMTESKTNMIADGRSDLADWCARLRDTPDELLMRSPKVLWTTSELLTMYEGGRPTKVTNNGLSRALRTAGFEQRLIKVNSTFNSTQRLWQVRGHKELGPTSKPDKWGKVFLQERGERDVTARKKS